MLYFIAIRTDFTISVLSVWLKGGRKESAVALGNTKLGEISDKSLIENTSKTSVYLKNLMELGIVKREFSVSGGTKEWANAGKGVYRLTNHFFRFWYAFVFTNYSDLEAGDVEGVYNYVILPRLHEFASFVFEDICREFVRSMQKANLLPFRYSKMGCWWGKTSVRTDSDRTETRETEIDIVAFSQHEKEYLVSECKFKNKPFSYSEYLNTAAKLASQKIQAIFYYYLFSENGFDRKLVEEAADSEYIKLFTLSEIVKGLP